MTFSIINKDTKKSLCTISVEVNVKREFVVLKGSMSRLRALKRNLLPHLQTLLVIIEKNRTKSISCLIMYINCHLSKGPVNWPGITPCWSQCGGNRQSPVNIRRADATYSNIGSFTFNIGVQQDFQFSTFSNGNSNNWYHWVGKKQKIVKIKISWNQ